MDFSTITSIAMNVGQATRRILQRNDYAFVEEVERRGSGTTGL